MARTLLKNGIVVTSNATYQADLVLDGPKISEIVQTAQVKNDDLVIDAQGCYILPGVIDAHTHIQLDTGIYHTADNWEIGTTAAAWGGVTTVIDFATQYPGWSLRQAVENRQREAANAVIDYSFHCMITDFPLEAELQNLIDLGVISYKLFTTYRPNYYVDDAIINRVMQAAAKYGGLVMVHCENDAIVSDATETLVKQDKTSWFFHGRGRPALAEQEAIQRVLFLAQATDAAVYIVHCSTGRSVRLVREAVRRGVKAYCETCPQYLLLDESLYMSDNPEYYILQPPLRDKQQNAELWRLIAAGDVDVLSTDHCDYSLAQKREHKEFTATPGGLPGLETLLPLLYTHSVDPGQLTLNDLVRLLSTTPAKLFGLADRKGDIRVGLDADLVIYDPAPRSYITAGQLHGVAGYSPYEGHRIRGAVRTVLSRGETVIKNRQFTGKAGHGQFLRAKV